MVKPSRELAYKDPIYDEEIKFLNGMEEKRLQLQVMGAHVKYTQLFEDAAASSSSLRECFIHTEEVINDISFTLPCSG